MKLQLSMPYSDKGLGASRIRAWCLVLILLSCYPTWMRAEDPLARVAADATKHTPIVTLSPSGDFLTRQDPDGPVVLMVSTSGTRRVLRAAQSDPVTISWARSGRSVAVTDGLSASVYLVPGGKLLRHWEGEGFDRLPQLSPDGRELAFVREHNLWLAPVSGGSPRALTSNGGVNLLVGEPDSLYASEFKADSHYWWSPDSKSIAYIETEFTGEDHYPKAGTALPSFRLKTVDIATGATKTIASSNDQWPYILRVAWSPDRRQIAAYRMNRLQTVAELFVSDTSTAAQYTVLTEKDAYWVNAPDTPLFVDGGKQMVVTSERSGHRRVYLYTLDGILIRDLTPDDLEVYHLHASAGPSHEIYVSGATGDRQWQNLYRINYESGASGRITSDEAWHDVDLDGAGSAYLDRFSSASQPPSVWWHSMAGAKREIVTSATPPIAVSNIFLTIKTHDGILLPARFFKPLDFDAKKRYPVIVYTFSGPQGRVAQDAWGGWQMAWNRYMTQRGYLVLAVDARGSAGYGHLFEEYLHYRLGAQETTDLREVIFYLNQQEYVDGQRLGIWGCDYGAQIAMHAMMEIPGGFKAGFADSPILDWDNYDAYFAERYLGLPKGRIADYDDSSPLDSAGRMTGDLEIVSSPANPVIRPDHLAALDDALALPKNRKISKHIHRIQIDDPDYRSNAVCLARLFSDMDDFFQKFL